MPRKKNRLRIIPLGGMDEIGKNMTVVEHGNDMVLIDAGLMFPDEGTPGVDLVLPDWSYVLKRKDKLRGIIVTHGHEDHTGALPYLLRDLGQPVPVFATRLTLGLIGGKLEEHALKKVKLREIKAGGGLDLGVFTFEFIAMNHSIPDGVAVFVHTPVGNLLFTGDFKFDQTPIDGRKADYAALTEAGNLGVLLLLSDSTNAEVPGTSRPEADVGATLSAIFKAAEKRIVVASFASHIHRIQQVCDAAVECGRKVVVTGRSMVRNTQIARDLGYLHIADADIIDSYDAKGLAPEQVVVLSTGSQGEPLSALARMANQDHKTVNIEEGDTVVISATPVPGNEKAVSRIINKLSKAGAKVFHRQFSDVHVSGHAAAEELKLLLNLVRPRYFVPMHGETRHLYAHADLAQKTGVPKENVFIMENGDCLELTAGSATLGEPVDSGVVYVDGLGVGDVGNVVLRDRQVLARDGIATIVVAIDAHKGQVMGEVELVTRGVVFVEESEDLLGEARQTLQKVLEKTSREGVTDHRVLQNALREALSSFFWDRMRRRPMIIPIVMEV